MSSEIELMREKFSRLSDAALDAEEACVTKATASAQRRQDLQRYHVRLREIEAERARRARVSTQVSEQ